MKVAIIGTAGRKQDGDSLNEGIFSAMVEDVKIKVAELLKHNQDIEIISGGAAYADHLAVILFLAGLVENLTLHFPTDFDEKFKETDNYKYQGNIANYYHRKFTEKVGIDSLADISEAIEKGAKVFVNKKGFKARNLQVGDCDLIIAYTFGESESVPKDGGTKHTWDNSKAKVKIHVPIKKLIK